MRSSNAPHIKQIRSIRASGSGRTPHVLVIRVRESSTVPVLGVSLFSRCGNAGRCDMLVTAGTYLAPNRDGGMAMAFGDVVETAGKVVDGAGVTVMVIGALAASVAAARRTLSRDPNTYRLYRRQLGRSILLGLELLVAADIIRTVAVTPTVRGVAVLAGIVLIRIILSFSLELEITGRWPWQKAEPQPTAG
jgi:uncharacterized membrane protein